MVSPALSLDFTSAVLDPRITFTRALATATRVNASGLIESVAADTARFDFSPATLACRGMLVEEARTNSLFPSNDFSGYILSNTAVVLNAGISPDGTGNANKINETAVSATHFIRKDTALANATYTASIYVKAAERSACAIQLADGVAGGAAWKFNLATGVSTQDTGVSAGSWTGISGQIRNEGNGWYRCTITATKGAGTNLSVRVHTLSAYTSSVVSSYLGVVGSGVLAYGLQLEAGASPTSYIPTTSAAVTRNADVAVMTGANFSDWWQVGAGGAQVQATPSTVSGIRPLIQFDDGTADNLIALRGNTTNPELYIVDGGVAQAQIDAGTISANTAYNLFGVWNTNNCAAKLNNGTPVTDTSASIPTVTQARLGSDGSNYLNGHLASINYYTGDQIAGIGRYMYTRRKNKVVQPSIF
jgi:hypothetical protein